MNDSIHSALPKVAETNHQLFPIRGKRGLLYQYHQFF
jgi:hypothetical protein